MHMVGRGTKVGVVVVLLVLALGGAALVVSHARASEQASPAKLRLVRVAGGLDMPLFVTQAPGEPRRFYVVEQRGFVRLVENGKVRPTPFLDVSFKIAFGGEQGLLGLAFPRDYARSQVVYVNYTATDTGATVIDRYRVRNGRADPDRREQIFTVAQPYENHNGGNLAFGPDGKLWVGLGDGGDANDPENRSQNRDSLLGKMFRLDVSQANPKPELVAVGLRNPWRYSFDRANGDLWIGDVGQDEIEEVDVLRRGTTGLVNFGWDVYEGRKRVDDKSLAGPGRLVFPVAQYDHEQGISITGGYVYRGKKVPSLRGRYLYGDYGSGRIWSISAKGGKPRLESIRVPRLSSFGEDAAGELYVVSHGGSVSRIAR